MISKLLLVSACSLAMIPSAYAQQVDLKAFTPAGDVQQPFSLLVTGAYPKENQLRPDAFDGLLNEFVAFETEKSRAQSDTTVHRGKKMAKGTTPASGSSTFDAAHPRDGCDYPRYAPSPRLPAAAEQRRAIWYPAMAEAACEAGLPVHLFDALIIQESRYNPVAVSPKGATGLAQLMPASARILGVRNILDPRENMRGGARYLRALLDEFGRFDLALAAYNAGAGRVRATGRVPRINETIHYVSSILVTMQRQLSAPMPLRE
ncbi:MULTISPECIES: lytic transglycosylase domain-containing protein [unclassified Novosphingobium]|uniref:lytic transglycosylase domain-containing protein n=1 Tax=unclassified Novosphingobium TaxID=2644732 RepID=UPI000A5B2E88|nr:MULTISPECIES: lytic transglycosylase domain-containing protein [unclassified Novosphingobium]